MSDIYQEEQELTPRPFTGIELTARWVLALRLENIYLIAKHLDKDFGLERGLEDELTKALRELKQELTTIITKRESK